MCVYSGKDFKDGYFTDNRKDKTKRFTKKFWSVLGTVLFTVAVVAMLYVVHITIYCCM